MSEAASPLLSRVALEQHFQAGLAHMLAGHESLGVYILVLANALQDPALWQALRGDLAQRHHRLARDRVAALRAGRHLAEPEDDLMVFLKLLAIGFGQLEPVRQKRVAGAEGSTAFELQFNPVRALRPARMSHARVEGLRRPFEPGGFHFNKPFLAREVLWEGVLEDKLARLLYNKFPFAPLHGLLVPEPGREHPQFLTPELHGWAWEVAHRAGKVIPGFGLAYNAYGAHASVNHLHFQTFARATPLPILLAGTAYPLPSQRCVDVGDAWFQLDELHQRNQVYNLVYTHEGVLIIPRARQGETSPEPWSAGLAWSEVAGVFPVASRDDYDGLDHSTLSMALARIAG